MSNTTDMVDPIDNLFTICKEVATILGGRFIGCERDLRLNGYDITIRIKGINYPVFISYGFGFEFLSEVLIRTITSETIEGKTD